jgi:ATP-binding cassette, subfamily B, bacterial
MSQPGLHGAALLWRVLELLRPYRGRTVLAAAAAIVQAGLAIAPAIALQQIIEELTSEEPAFAPVLEWVLLALGAILVSALIGVGVTWLTARIGQGVVYDLRERLFTHLVAQTVGYHTRTRQGDLLSKILNDVAGIQATIESAVVTIVRNTCMAVAVTALMFALEWRLALVTLVVVPLIGVPLRFASRATARARRRVQEQYAELTAYLQETLGLSGVLLVRGFGRQAAERERFAALNDELRRRQVTAAMTARWFGMSMVVLRALTPTLVLLAGAYFVSVGLTTLPTVLVFATVVVGLLGSALNGLATSAVGALGSVPLWQRVFAVLDEAPDVVERPEATDLRAVRGEVRFEDVTFRYPGQERPALENVSLDVEPGQVVALVGPSGAGKTTLGALVMRFADPQQGRVLLDGVDVRDLTLATLGRALGVVFQDPFLFHTSLRDNIRFGRPNATDGEVEAAAEEAQLAALVRSLPGGLDTIVGERGHRLSGGEKQRVAIARVLLKDPPILLLDEATAHLDAISERELQAALVTAVRGRTALVIAHRLSTVRYADLILVLDHGRVVERGAHDELLGMGGLYASLHDGKLATGAAPPRAG